MNRSRVLGGLVLVVIGASIALLPFLSVWRLTASVLDELPQVDGVTPVDSRNRVGAMFDGDFVLGTRTYPGVEPRDLEQALTGRAFQPQSMGGEPRWVKECCGDYDAVVVAVEPQAGGSRAVVTVADGDVQAGYPFLVVLGLLVAGPGLLLLLLGRPAAPAPYSPVSTVPPDRQ